MFFLKNARAHLDTATKQPRANGNADFQIGRCCGHERASDAGAEPGAPVAVSRGAPRTRAIARADSDGHRPPLQCRQNPVELLRVDIQ